MTISSETAAAETAAAGPRPGAARGDVLVDVRGVSKRYRRYARPRDRLLEWLALGRVRRHEDFVALQPLDLEVRAGECLAVIGENGAGKSTLLKAITGVLWPTTGTVATRGRVVSLLELGTGFHPELDGITNLVQSAALLGVPEAELRGRLDAILEFAGLGEQVHQPVKTYSSGQFVRLAFALFAHLEPDVYVVDEALSVGDVFFQQKCFRFLESLKRRGVALLLASHDMQAVLRLADRALWLDHGAARMQGDPVDVVNAFHARGGLPPPGQESAATPAAAAADGGVDAPADARLGDEALARRQGDGAVRIVGARFLDADGRSVRAVQRDERLTLEIYAHASAAVDDLTLGFQITDRMNTVVFGQSLFMATRQRLELAAGERVRVDVELPARLLEGVYTVQLVAADCQLHVTGRLHDSIPGALTLEVAPSDDLRCHGLVGLDTTFHVHR